MKIKYRKTPTPHLLLSEVFTDAELEDICREIYVLHPSLKAPEDTGSAGVSRNLRKQNSGLFMHETYASAHMSPTYRHTVDALTMGVSRSWKPEWLAELYDSIHDASVLISHYADGDQYLPHRDSSVFTGLVWLYDEPKQFEGGDLVLTDYDYTVPCEANTGIIFLSHEYHAVEPVKGDGRYCISCFLSKS